MKEPITADQVRVVPANEASWHDLTLVFGTADYAARCRCQRFKVLGWFWAETTLDERVERQQAQTGADDPGAEWTSGLVAYVDGEPAGWVAVEPRTAYPALIQGRSPVPWKGRQEDRDDDGVWAVTCTIVRKDYRGRGLTYHLARASVRYARDRGARALEAYSMITQPGKEITWGELHVGARQVFEKAGFTEVSHPTKRRAVMRVEFGA